MATKLLREKFKTFSGAAKRAAFERGLAPFEFQRGYKARLYGYRVVEHDGFYRVERYLKVCPVCRDAACETKSARCGT